ncbi:MAG: ABC transporter substrate-binding protein [Fibrobacterota bacterium]
MQNFWLPTKPLRFKRHAPLLLLLALLFASCAAPREATVLISMIPEQEKDFRETLVPPFEKKNNCRLRVVSYRDSGDVEKAVRSHPGKVLLVKTPFERIQGLLRAGLMMSVDSAAGEKKLKEIRDKYFLLQLATFDGKLYYFPRKFECRIMMYLKSRVAEAVAHWEKKKGPIAEALRRHNGLGLPANYALETDPNQWDFYDVFVAGWYWAHTDSTGNVTPKIGHRGKRYSGTAQRLVDRVYEMGGDRTSIVKMTGDFVADAFEWEAVYAQENIYNPRMLKEGWSGSDVWKGFKNNDVYLAFMTQLDGFFIHGTYSRELPGYLDNPDDLGFAVMPKGVSLQLNADGSYRREGTHAVSTGGWWWGIPKDSPYPDLSVKLAEWILDNDNQVDGCTKFGMIPVRKDILGDIGLLFGRNWLSEIYDVSLKQVVYNQFRTVPVMKDYKLLEDLYLDAWFDMVAGGNWAGDGEIVSRDYIRNRLNTMYRPRADSLSE